MDDLELQHSVFPVVVALALAASIFLVMRYQSHLRKNSSPHYFFLMRAGRRGGRIASIVTSFISSLVIACVGAAVLLLLWDLIAGIFHLPKQLNLSFPIPWRQVFGLNTYWIVVGCIVAVRAQLEIDHCKRTPLYHVFLSYKSQDARIARRLTDLLLASRLRVWFGEYEILLRNYDEFGKAMENGLAECEMGILVIGKQYPESKDCLLEAATLLRRLGTRKVLVICLSAEGFFKTCEMLPQLHMCPLVKDQNNSVQVFRDFLQQYVSSRLAPLIPEEIPAQPLNPVKMQFMGRPLTLDLSGWEPDPKAASQGQRFTASADNGRAGQNQFLCYARYFWGGKRIAYMNLIAGPELSSAGQREEGNYNDRTLYQMLLKYARDTHIPYLGAFGTRTIGLHLFRHSGLSQFSLTYTMVSDWMRKYSVVIPNPVTQQNAEFVFTFGFMGRFEEYCAHVELMERLVDSLVWN